MDEQPAILQKLVVEEETIFMENAFMEIQQVIEDCLKMSCKDGLPSYVW
jgi:hypothetical protein